MTGGEAGVVDCFSYKSGITDGSPEQTTEYPGLRWEGSLQLID